jgi:hypothetical protein
MSEENDDKTVEDYVNSDPSPDEQPEVQPEEAEQVETPEPEPETEEDETSGLSEGLKKRFSKLTADKHRLKSANEEKEKKLAEYEAKIQRYETKGPERPTKPSLDQFDYDEDKFEEARDQYFEDLADWKAQQRLGEFEQKGAVDKIVSEKQKLRDNYVKNVEKSAIEDYEDKFNTLVGAFEKAQVNVPEYLIEAIQIDENGPKIVEYLSGNTDKAINLTQMGTVQAALEIGRISAKIANGKPLQTTKAPKPVLPVKGSGSKPIDKESLSVSDWVNRDASELGLDR